ncbi:DUF4189 domain-containing protein [Chelatococcus sp. SYSU_G07232]|uniref:DUF4189 domain-containing protein n=1 Tax=Chelatococcus albus TaxID=3047466 RepID=A0ABT7AJZ3_9HYPH|nr:DUF4189 domain-containing protein [Chelatococcus sp. SYSU_G07232]MDJ1159430.1 DUF4189 domain-containing protein [Chelatococcus sp. SYSU_G07232]
MSAACALRRPSAERIRAPDRDLPFRVLRYPIDARRSRLGVHMRHGTTLVLTFMLFAAAPSAAEAYGALAVDYAQGTRFGFSRNQPTEQKAREVALGGCGAGCTVIVTFRKSCAAYAADQTTGSPAEALVKGPAAAAVRDQALSDCRKRGGRQCSLRVWGCD